VFLFPQKLQYKLFNFSFTACQYLQLNSGQSVDIYFELSTAHQIAYSQLRDWGEISPMESAEFEFSLIAELNRVLLQAAEEVESEERLDLAYEVLETVRYEQAHVSWLDRLRNTSSPIEIRLAHEQLPQVVGVVKHLADPFMIVESSTTQFLLNFDFVSAVSGLSELSQRSGAPDAINWLDNVWFHDLADQQLTSTWYLVGGQTVDGICRRTGFDSLDVE
jgi:hypothetical protein